LATRKNRSAEVALFVRGGRSGSCRLHNRQNSLGRTRRLHQTNGKRLVRRQLVHKAADAFVRKIFYMTMNPGSKRAAALNQEHFFGRFTFSPDHVFDALAHFEEICTGLLGRLHEKVTDL
jgi:hypothetical protein